MGLWTGMSLFTIFEFVWYFYRRVKHFLTKLVPVPLHILLNSEFRKGDDVEVGQCV